MQHTSIGLNHTKTVRVTHDLQRQILEITSFIRVLNNYYNKKNKLQNQVKPLILKQFREEGLKTLENNKDWLHSIPTVLNTLSNNLLSKIDSFKFPDSILLFEAWMNLGIEALYPRFALYYKFPGFLKGELTRYIFHFTFSTSRGFGFPIYFGPEFYGYILTYGKVLEPILRWSHTVCHRANQAIFLVGKRFNIKRHHPGEFESVIISEYMNNVFKGIDTLLHGYFTNDPKKLGNFSTLEDVLKNIIFSYSIGDHAMSIRPKMESLNIEIPLITHQEIVKKYNVDFYSYINELKMVKRLLIRKIILYKKRRKDLIKKLKKIERIKHLFNRFKIIPIQNSKETNFFIIGKLTRFFKLMEKILELLWNTPLYTHTIHTPTDYEKEIISKWNLDEINNYKKESIDSVFLLYVKYYEKKYKFNFDEKEILDALRSLRDNMAKMWLYFKERQFKFAINKLNELSTLSLDDSNYNKSVKENLNNLIPIFSIYEIFNRSLSESVYPESIPQTKKFGAYFASFLSSRYNLLGVNLMHIFNNLAFRNWSYFIIKHKFNRNQFFQFVIKLPIWKYIPTKVKIRILKNNL
ncbi:MAG: hypothetical protein ACFE85_02505 [Candidatus Hodarchaeota archaeon]